MDVEIVTERLVRSGRALSRLGCVLSGASSPGRRFTSVRNVSHDWNVLSKELAPLVEHRGVP